MNANQLADTNATTAPEHATHQTLNKFVKKQTNDARPMRKHGKAQGLQESNAHLRERTHRLKTTRETKHPINHQTNYNEQQKQSTTGADHRLTRIENETVSGFE